MTKYALFSGNAVSNVSLNPENEFHPDIAALFEKVGDEVEAGFQRNEDGTITAPVIPEAPEIIPVPAPRVLTRLEFLRLFTREERIALTQARSSDPVVNDFFTMLDLATEVSFEDPDITDGIAYLGKNKLLTAARAAEILGG